MPVLSILVGWGVLRKNIAFGTGHVDSYPPTANTVRIMTYNVHNFKRYGAKNDVSTKQEILAIIAEHQPDVIGFQEFYSRKHGQYDMVDSIQKILHTNSYYFEAFQSNDSEAIGMAIFSKFPIVAHGLIQLSEDKESGNQCLYIDVKKGGKTFRMYSVHLQSMPI